MKRKFALAVCLLAAILALTPLLYACDKGDDSAKNGETLVVYNWEDYIEPDMLTEFEDYYEEKTGRPLSIVYTTFDTNETMMTKVLKGDANVDLICPSEYAIEKLLTAGLVKNLAELQTSLAPRLESYGVTLDSLGNIEPDVFAAIKQTFGAVEVDGAEVDMTEYMVPYMWGTLGILYNRKYITIEELDRYGWGVLWNAGGSSDIEGKILVKDSIRDTYCAAVLYLRDYGMLPDGLSSLGKPYAELTTAELINCTDAALLKAAEKALTEQRKHIAGYEVDFGKDDMVNEIVYIDLAWSGDALWAIEESEYNEETEEYLLGYYVPESGSNIWYDGWIIPTSSKNDLAALMFIDFMCRPTTAIWNAMAIGYTSAVAKDILAADEEVLGIIEECEYDVEEYFGDTGRYPVVNDKLGVMRNFGASNDVVVQMWERAKAGTDVPWELIYCLIAIVAAVGLALGGYFIVQRAKLRPRRSKAPDADPPKE